MCNEHKVTRRDFIKKSALATAGAFLAPTILPSGRLFAATGTRKANHVVFCLFAGGVRQLESIQMADGNMMRCTLNGSAPISSDIAPGMTALLSSPVSLPLQNYGTLFKEFRYNNGPTGHVSGHHTAITGVYNSNDLNINLPPTHPTIFEYYRKHNSPAMSALNAWWISDSLGPYPALNFSSDKNYGALYGANYIQPATFLSQGSYNELGNAKTFSTAQKTAVSGIKTILDKNFGHSYASGDAGIINTDVDRASLETYINASFLDLKSGQYTDPWGVGASVMNNDMFNLFIAEKIMQQFKPELLVVNMQGVDVCHFNFTNYCDALRKADFALAHLWNTIQTTPGMMNDTILIAVPEHGRNQSPNTVIDSYGRYAVDHTGDAMSREIFCLVLGPAGVVKQNQIISTVTGESIDVLPTIADILGFYNDIPSSYRANMGTPLSQAF